MFNRKISATFLGLVLGFAQYSSAAIAGPIHKQHRFARHGSVLPPFSYIQFCVHHRSACTSRSGRLTMAAHNKVKLTGHLRQQLASINSQVNSSMKPKADQDADKWSVGGKYGDCEDFALTKRARLIAAGWPSRALSLTVVKTGWGEGHAILSVRTDNGVLVLDNLSHKVRNLNRVPYRIVSMQGDSPMQWSAN
jgi:predicted transglutaminase-like cysteine proteinase